MRSTARVETEHGSRYLQQLCKHWSHRFPVEFDPQHGEVRFDGARCGFDATATSLILTIDLPDEAAAERMEGVVASHLHRFAFREDLAIRWSRGPGDPATDQNLGISPKSHADE